MASILYAVGVGPGDPELLTLKAVKNIKNADCIACLQKDGEPGIAYRIAEKAVPEISEKEILLLDFPMRKDELRDAHRKAADRLMHCLSSGKNVAFLTLGDPGFYSTFYYVAGIIKEQGYGIEIVSGITSFSAASAKLQHPLSLGNGSVMITSGKFCCFDGTLMILKAGSNLKEIKSQAAENHKNVYMIENCGMPDERIYNDPDLIPDEAGYFTIVIVE